MDTNTDIKSLSNEELTAALADAHEKAKALFALKAPTVEQADEADVLAATKRDIEALQAERKAAVKAAEAKFAAARAEFSTEDAPEDESDEDESDEVDADEADEVADEADAEVVEAAEDDKVESAEDEADVVEAGIDHSKGQTIKATAATAKKVAKRNRRPVVAKAEPVVITAAADVPEFSTGQQLTGMDQVAKAITNRVKGFPKFNAQAAKAVHSQSGGAEVLSKFGAAAFGLSFDDTLTASGGANGEYAAVRAALKQDIFEAATLTAAGWCAPSETVYSYIADYVVDGLVTVPEVSAPRGGLLLTTGPEQFREANVDLDTFGFIQTEAQAEAQTVKTCETIECPDFIDYRLDAIGYCWKIPLLTQKAYPELVTDALRLSGVLYAHKVNEYIINEIEGFAVDRDFSGYGPSFTDALEALSLIAVKERRKWNLGASAILEVKLPVWAQEVFRADMSRRSAVAYDSVKDAQIAAHFADRKLAVEYVSDWQELEGDDLVLPGTFKALMYPKGTIIKAVEDVINLSAVYDAASLSINEYTGVFFEQGILVAKAGYGVSKVDIPVNTAGEMGALTLSGLGDAHVDGSF